MTKKTISITRPAKGRSIKANVAVTKAIVKSAVNRNKLVSGGIQK